MRIGIVDPASFSLPYACFFARGLVEAGHHVSLICSYTSYNEELLDDLTALFPESVEVSRYAVSRTRSTSILGSLRAYARMLRAIVSRRRAFDRIILQYGIFLPLDLILIACLRDRLVLTIHDDVPHGFHGKHHAPTWLRALVARHLVFPSQAVFDRFMGRYRWPALAAKASVLQHGTIAAKLEPLRTETVLGGTDQVEAGTPVLTFFGTVKPYKGIEFLVDLAERRLCGPLEIHGRWDPGLNGLKQRALHCGIMVHDDYLSADALDQLLRERRLYVLPYHAASQSGVLYLLLHYARPFICTTSGDLGDFLRREKLTDLMLQTSETSELAERIAYAEQHYDFLRSRLLEIRKRYDWCRIIARSPIFEHG